MIYLCSPYTHPNPDVQDHRFLAVCQEAAKLMQQGIHVFSPIAHCHTIAQVGDLPTSWEFWAAYDRVMISSARALCVVQLPGWQESRGVAAEIKIAEELGIPVLLGVEALLAEVR